MTAYETQAQLDLMPTAPAEAEKFLVRKRDGHLEPFTDARIQLALESAYKDELGLTKDQPLPADVATSVAFMASAVAQKALELAADGKQLEVELIQDLVENELMRSGQHAIARSYILYREERKKARLLRGQQEAASLNAPTLHVTLPDGTTEPLDPQMVRRKLIRACAGLEDRTDWRELAEETLQNLYDGVKCEEIDKAMIFAAKARIEREPAYSYVAARLADEHRLRRGLARQLQRQPERRQPRPTPRGALRRLPAQGRRTRPPGQQPADVRPRQDRRRFAHRT